MEMPSAAQVKEYLSELHNTKKINLSYFGRLSDYKTASQAGMNKATRRAMGYGEPYLLVYTENKKERKSIISTMRIGSGFGHDFRADRVDGLVLEYDTWNKLPKHCKVDDLGAFDRNTSSLISLGNAGEFFVLRQMIEGTEYVHDLTRLSEQEKFEPQDIPRTKALARYLASIHKKKYRGGFARDLYARKIRDTVGHGECIFGLSDSYPFEAGEEYGLEEIEEKCIAHRWKLKEKSHRLCQVHGDFHPANILFSKKTGSEDFRLLDRSRGEWGEPADDVCALSINYIFASLKKYGTLKGVFLELFEEFLGAYLDETKDEEIMEALPLFYTFRALVIASPVWYPELTKETRKQIISFANNILDSSRFEISRVNEYLTVGAKF
jgi:thiamine kinase-like enzyme